MYEKLIKRVNTKLQRTEVWIKETSSQIAAGFNNIIADVAEFCGNQELCKNAKRRQQEFESKNAKWSKRKEELRVQDRYEEKGGTYEIPDLKLVQETISYLDKRYCHNAPAKMVEISPLERTKEVEIVAKDMGRIMGVEVTKVNIYIPSRENYNECGSFNRNTGEVNINIRQLFSENEEILVDVISTIAHELYHARQWNAVSGKVEYGYSAEKLVSWGGNFLKYYPPICGPLYYYQPLEADARGFENAIKDSLK